MSERSQRVAKRRRLNSPSTVYESAPVKKQKRFPPKRKSVRKIVPETPQKKKQNTLTQAAWLEKVAGLDSGEDEESPNVRTVQSEPKKRVEGSPVATTAPRRKEAPKSTIKKKRKRKIDDEEQENVAPEESDVSDYAAKPKPRKKKVRMVEDSESESARSKSKSARRTKREMKPALESQRTLTQLDDFLSPETSFSGRSATSASSRRRKTKQEIEAERRRQRTLTQMMEVAASDEEEAGIEDSDQEAEVDKTGPQEIDETQRDEAPDPDTFKPAPGQHQDGHEELRNTDDAGNDNPGESIGEDTAPTQMPAQSPATRDAMRVPPDLKEARRRALLATQFPQTQAQSALPSPTKSAKSTGSAVAARLLQTPQKQRTKEIPDSQSPSESSLSTQKTQRFFKSPLASRSTRVIPESPLKSRTSMFLRRQDTTGSGSSTISTQVRNDSLESLSLSRTSTREEMTIVETANGPEPESPMHEADNQQIAEQTEESAGDAAATAVDQHDCGSKTKAVIDTIVLSSSPAEEENLATHSMLEDDYVIGRSPSVELGSPYIRASNVRHSDEGMPASAEQELNLDSPVNVRDSRKPPVAGRPRATQATQSSRSSEADAQLLSELQQYTQRHDFGRSDALSSPLQTMRDLPPPPKPSQRKNTAQPPFMYPSQASTIDVTQRTIPPSSAAPVAHSYVPPSAGPGTEEVVAEANVEEEVELDRIPSSQKSLKRAPYISHMPPKTIDPKRLQEEADVLSSPVRPSDLVIPSSPSSIAMLTFSSPVHGRVLDTQDRKAILMESMGWSLPPGPPALSDDDELEDGL